MLKPSSNYEKHRGVLSRGRGQKAPESVEGFLKQYIEEEDLSPPP